MGTTDAATTEAAGPAMTPIAPEITIDDFGKVDLRVGIVKLAEAVKGADKLLHLKVDIGEAEPRTIVAGIALAYKPEALVGRKVVIVANLAPRKLRGLTSQGMIVADSHCHLDDEQFDSDREAAIERAREAGVKCLLAIGTGDGPPDLECAVRLADLYPFIYATVGVHPNDAAKADSDTFDHLLRLTQHPKVVAMGEIGLDYHWGVPKELQEPLFCRQLDFAAKAGMPVVIHTRDAWDDTLRILRERWAPTGFPCVMHCFTGDVAQANQCLELGFTLAFGGVATFPKSGAVREAALHTPLHRMLLETDAPYLAPVPFRGRRNEPAYVAHTAQTIASLRGMSVEELGGATTRNFEHIFLSRREGEHPLH